MLSAKHRILQMTGDILSVRRDFRGKSRVARALVRSFGAVDEGILISRNGLRFRVGGGDLLERDLLFGLGSTRRVKQALVSLAGDARCVWDVGGNIGSVSLHIASHLPHALICVFEPSPLNAAK